MRHIILIDDNKEVIDALKVALSASFPDCRVESYLDFDEGSKAVSTGRPDVVILDLFAGDIATGDNKGDSISNTIWEHHFCPLVVYSAFDDEYAGPKRHPLIKIIEKGTSSIARVIEALNQLKPITVGIDTVNAEVDSAIGTALRDIAPHVETIRGGHSEKVDILVRASRRRLAALMDEATSLGDRPIETWEQYIFPVLTKHLIAGDIIKLKSGTDEPSSFRLVLSPTCDMVERRGRCTLSEVLTAKCIAATDFLERGMNFSRGTGKSRIEDKLARALNEPHQDGISLLPECPGVFPLMAVNFRHLELISISAIYGTDATYERVVSLDSPFREFILWSYLQLGCRPGVPPRDHATAITALLSAWQALGSTTT